MCQHLMWFYCPTCTINNIQNIKVWIPTKLSHFKLSVSGSICVPPWSHTHNFVYMHKWKCTAILKGRQYENLTITLTSEMSHNSDHNFRLSCIVPSTVIIASRCGRLKIGAKIVSFTKNCYDKLSSVIYLHQCDHNFRFSSLQL